MLSEANNPRMIRVTANRHFGVAAENTHLRFPISNGDEPVETMVTDF